MKKFINKKNTAFLILLVVAVTFVLFGNNVLAQDGGGVGTTWAHWLVGGIARAIVSVLGWILAKLMGILIYVAQYDNFTNATAIKKGWIIARDIANMFFVVILLVIAFATILRVEKYNYKKWLPKLILMAILINFSKTISGLLIDVSQVIMLSFVNAFSAIGAGKLTDMLGIKDWQSLKGVEDINNWEIAAAYVLAVFYSIIALVTVAAMVGILVMRIIMIWVYVVLSPFAFLLMSFPDGASYASRWWSEFTKNLIVGPVLAFFIWLSFAALGTTTTEGYQVLGEFDQSDTAGAEDFDMAKCNRDENGMCEYGTSDLMIQFIISIAMLIGGMKIAQEIGGAGGGIAGSAMGKVKGMGRGMSKWGAGLAGAAGGYALGKAKSGGKWAGKRVASKAGTLVSSIDKSIGNKVDERNKTSKYGDKGLIGTNLNSLATYAGRFSAKKRANRVGSPEEEELRQELRNHYEESKTNPEAVMKFNEKEYQMATSGVNKGKMVEVVGGKQTSNVLKDTKSKDVKAMTATSAAWHDAKKQNNRKIDTETNNKQVEKVETAKKKYSEMNLNSGEINRKLESAATSAVDKMALAMIKASKGSFKTKSEIDEAKKYIGGNKTLTSQFNDEIDKSRPDLNYNLDSSVDVARLKKRIDSGKVDSTKLNSKAYGDEKLLATLQDYHGDDFERVAQTVSKRGSDYSKTLSTGLLSLKNANYTNPNRSAEENRKGAIKVAKIHADINGKWEQSFADQNGKVDIEALKDYLKGGSAKNLNKMDIKDYENLSETNPEAKKAIVEGMTAGQLVHMSKENSNNELVRKIRDDILKNGDDVLRKGKGGIILPGKTGTESAPQNYKDIQSNAELLSL